jgi:hypothetical protein
VNAILEIARRHRAWATIAACAILATTLLACTDNGTRVSPTPAETTTPQPPTDTATPAPTDTATPVTETPQVAVCLEAKRFTADGTIPLDLTVSGESYRVVDLRWASHDGCERFVVDIGRAGGGSADRVDAVSVEVLRELGIVRIQLAAAEEVAADATDAEFLGELLERAYVVRAADRSLYVDLHLGRATEVAASLLTSPARVVVDLRPAAGEAAAPPAREALTVMLAPRSGMSSYPIVVSGYARHFEANVVVRLVQNGEVAAQRVTSSTDWTETWGGYALTLDDGPRGNVTLQVGDYSPRDGAWEGVEVELTLR